MHTCVIFNPAARGNKARHFRRHLSRIAGDCALKATTGPGEARRLAAEAVADGFELVVAAGGDGTVNETLNGIGDVPGGFGRARLGVLPLGTINVFARELAIPLDIESAWKVLLRGNEMKIDLPWVEFFAAGIPKKQYFVQLAGGGLDARAIEIVSWSLKKRIGPLAYFMAGLKAVSEPKPLIVARAEGGSLEGELILIGNGRFYGGTFAVFPGAKLVSGHFEVCGVPRMNWRTLFHCGPHLLLRGKLPESAVRRFQASRVSLSSSMPAAFELDGEWIGRLPAVFGLDAQALRLCVP